LRYLLLYCGVDFEELFLADVWPALDFLEAGVTDFFAVMPGAAFLGAAFLGAGLA
jgi:hypothetical protein